jgi:hypothetical protein
MKCLNKIFRRSTGLEDICYRVSDFVTGLGKSRLISISTMAEAASSQRNSGGISVDSCPIEYVVIVWFWGSEGESDGK